VPAPHRVRKFRSRAGERAREAREATALTLDRILEVAVKICERDGFEAISMRRLADELGVSPMAMYRHVEAKAQLLELIADKYIVALDLAEDEPDWRERLIRMFTSLREVMEEHPVLAHVIVAQPVKGPTAYAFAEAVLAVLRGHGCSDEDAVETFGVLASFTVGFTLIQRSRVATGSQAGRERMEDIRTSPQHSNLAAVAEDFVRWPRPDVFRMGLERLLGAESRPSPSAWPSRQS
jgi:AcrR family transcriptional regulator